jgi:hypothetical protein
MPKSKHRKNHKQKLAVRKKSTTARRNNIKKLVGELETEFARIEAPTVTSTGVFLTPTPDEYQIKENYDNLEI